MTAESNDGNAHIVRMYSDISGEFLLEGPGLNVSWRAEDDGTNIILSEEFVQPQPFGELGDHALDAVEYYCFKRINGTVTSWQISSDIATRNAGANMSTSLKNMTDPGQRLLSDSWPLLGIQIDWGQISSTSEPAVFTLGLIRDPVIQYTLPDGAVQMRSPYFRSSFANDVDALKFFMDDFERARKAAEAFDAELLGAGSAVSAEYSDLLVLTARQVLSSIDITIAKGSDGNWNFTDTLVFMKNLGAAGSDTPTSNISTQSVNTVDTLFVAFPAFLYFNPELAGYLLVPLLKYQDSPSYTLDYAAKNIGSAYPNATSDSINASHPYGIEETSNMLIMILAYTRPENTLTPTNQQWADYPVLPNNLPTSNQTNLALKGIIAIAAMSKIATIAGNSDDASQFNSTASSFIQTWKQNSMNSPQVKYFYGDEDITGLMYNLYADVLLGLNFVPSEVYSTLTTYYSNLINSNSRYGIPLMSGVPDLTSVSAMMLSAATATSNDTRNAMISQVHNFASSGYNNTPFGGYYNPQQGFITNENIAIDGHGINSPTIGSIFSLLVRGNSTEKVEDVSAPSSKSKAGGIAGGIAGLVLLGGCIYIFLRRRRRRADKFLSTRAEQGPTMRGAGPCNIIEPFPYSDVENLKLRNEINLLGSRPSCLPWSQKEPPAELRANLRESPVAHNNLAEASSHAIGGSSNGADLLPAESGSGNSLIGARQRPGTEPVPLLPGTAIDRDRALRDEVENLRRDVERLLQNGVEAASEAPPPSYRDD